MTLKRTAQALGTAAGCAALVLAGTLVGSPSLRADDGANASSDEARIAQGLQIAPVHLTYAKQDRNLVGLGSYIVNTFDCNGCHSAGPQTEFAPGHNPYFGQPKQENLATYLAGGRDFGAISAPPSPHIVSRNLTPDVSGLPEGGATFAEFTESIRDGIDHDHLHPNCSAAITTNCFPHGPGLPPFDGDLLQIMPWPTFQDWTDHDLQAVYAYLKAIPCTQTPSEAAAGVHMCS